MLQSEKKISPLQTLADLLPARVASPLSLNALREDLEASHRAVSHWMDVFDRFYFTYRIPPYVARRVRALKKMPKAYLWDWGLVPERGPRFENLVASHLLKFCHVLQDGEGFPIGLHYLRDASGCQPARTFLAAQARAIAAPSRRLQLKWPHSGGALT